MRPFALCALSALSANLGEVAAPIELVTKVVLRSELVLFSVVCYSSALSSANAVTDAFNQLVIVI